MANSRTLLSCCILGCNPWYRLLPENQMQWEVGSSSVPVCVHPSLPLHWMNSAYHFCASLSQEPLCSRHVISQWNKPRFQGYYICNLSSCHMPHAFSLTIPLDGIMTIIPQTCWIFFHLPELLLWPCILLQFLPQLWALNYRSTSQSKQQQNSLDLPSLPPFLTASFGAPQHNCLSLACYCNFSSQVYSYSPLPFHHIPSLIIFNLLDHWASLFTFFVWLSWQLALLIFLLLTSCWHNHWLGVGLLNI